MDTHQCEDSSYLWARRRGIGFFIYKEDIYKEGFAMLYFFKAFVLQEMDLKEIRQNVNKCYMWTMDK